jgi:hypothetical protein
MRCLCKAFTLITLVCLVLFSSSTLQASVMKNITLHEKLQVSNSQLDPGIYKVEIKDMGQTGELDFYKDKTVVAKVPVEVERLNAKVKEDSLTYLTLQGKLPRLTEVKIAGEDEYYKVLDKGNQTSSYGRN